VAVNVLYPRVSIIFTALCPVSSCATIFPTCWLYLIGAVLIAFCADCFFNCNKAAWFCHSKIVQMPHPAGICADMFIHTDIVSNVCAWIVLLYKKFVNSSLVKQNVIHNHSVAVACACALHLYFRSEIRSDNISHDIPSLQHFPIMYLIWRCSQYLV